MPLPWEVLNRCLTGRRKAVASHMGVSDSIVDRWCTPPASFDGEGKPSGLQRFIELALAIRAAGGDDSELIDFALSELGRMPSVRASELSEPIAIGEVASATREFADFLTEVAEAHRDDVLSEFEAERIEASLVDLHRVIAGQLRTLRAYVAACREARIRERRGPKRAMPRYLQLRRATA